MVGTLDQSAKVAFAVSRLDLPQRGGPNRCDSCCFFATSERIGVELPHLLAIMARLVADRHIPVTQPWPKNEVSQLEHNGFLQLIPESTHQFGLVSPQQEHLQ